MEKFRVCRRDVYAQNGPIDFHENAYIHRFEMLITFSFLKILYKQTAVMSVDTDLSYYIKTTMLFT